MDTIKELKNLDKNDILGALGLQTKGNVIDTVIPALGVFGAGLLIGTALGMLVAPKTGKAMRKQIGRRANEVYDRAAEAVDEIRTHTV
jgi:hypothetical protein